MGVAILAFVVAFLPLGSAEGATHAVSIAGFAFDPDDLTVAPGDSVRWTNQMGPTVRLMHDGCPGAGGLGPCEFESPELHEGDTFLHTFETAGVFPYRDPLFGFPGTIRVDDPLLAPDLAITDFDVEPVSPTKARIDAIVANQGDEGAGTSHLVVTYDNQGSPHVIANVTVAPLPAGANRSVSVSWSTVGKVGDFVVRAVADVNNDVVEADETNNDAQVAASVLLPPGTIDGIDVFDLPR